MNGVSNAFEPEAGERQQASPADDAALTGVRASLVSVVLLGITSWLGTFFGLLGFVAGAFIWLITWTLSLGFSIAALRNWHASERPDQLRRRAWAALGIDVALVVLICIYLWSVSMGNY